MSENGNRYRGCAHLKSSVLTTRLVHLGTQRRRRCLDCGVRFTTLEIVITPVRGRKAGAGK